MRFIYTITFINTIPTSNNMVCNYHNYQLQLLILSIASIDNINYTINTIDNN